MPQTSARGWSARVRGVSRWSSVRLGTTSLRTSGRYLAMVTRRASRSATRRERFSCSRAWILAEAASLYLPFVRDGVCVRKSSDVYAGTENRRLSPRGNPAVFPRGNPSVSPLCKGRSYWGEVIGGTRVGALRKGQGSKARARRAQAFPPYKRGYRRARSNAFNIDLQFVSTPMLSSGPFERAASCVVTNAWNGGTPRARVGRCERSYRNLSRGRKIWADAGDRSASA
jgi:hypothetical protein